MKTKWFVLVACILFAQASMAQFTVGVKAGTNITKIDGKSFKDEFSYGYHLGGFAMIGLGSKFAFQPEVMFNDVRSKVDSNFQHIYQNASSDVKDKNVKLNYLSVPLLLNYKAIGNFLSFQAGPQFGILLDQEKSLVQNGAEAFKKGDFSLVGGAQIKVSKILVSGRYVVGLKDIKNIQDIGNQGKWKSQTIQLSVGLSL